MDTKTAAILQDQFLLDKDVIYLNHGSFGATPRPVFESYQRWQRALEAQPTEFLGRRAGDLLEESRQVLARYLGTQAGSLVYVSNATYGLNAAARSVRLGPGDEVLTTNHEYGALDRTWRYLARKQGFKYINQSITVPVESEQAVIDQLWQAVTPQTRVIFLSHITSPTALILPVEQICRRARAQGIITIIDGAHAPGQIPLNLDALGADFYSGNLHKWLCAPKGAAFLYVRPGMIDTIEPLVVSWGYGNEKLAVNQLVDYLEWQGTRDISAFLAVPDAIKFQAENNWENIRAYCHALAVDSVRKISSLCGLPALSPLNEHWIMQMASAPLPAETDVTLFYQALYERFKIEIPVLEWHGHKLIRCSYQAYNTPEHADALIKAVAQLI